MQGRPDAADEEPETAVARQRRLAEIGEQVRNGTYKIDSLRLSKKIIEKHIGEKQTGPAARTRAAQS